MLCRERGSPQAAVKLFLMNLCLDAMAAPAMSVSRLQWMWRERLFRGTEREQDRRNTRNFAQLSWKRMPRSCRKALLIELEDPYHVRPEEATRTMEATRTPRTVPFRPERTVSALFRSLVYSVPLAHLTSVMQPKPIPANDGNETRDHPAKRGDVDDWQGFEALRDPAWVQDKNRRQV